MVPLSKVKSTTYRAWARVKDRQQATKVSHRRETSLARSVESEKWEGQQPQDTEEIPGSTMEGIAESEKRVRGKNTK